MAQVVRFTAWSDYLCPWCWVATQRLERIEQAFRGQIEIEWRTYLLRPRARGRRDPERFRRYTESWLRPAAEPDVSEFRVWASDEPPPTHSVPAHRVAKVAAELGPDAFRAVHRRLMQAYFAENRDISSFEVLRSIWQELGLPDAGFEEANAPGLEARVEKEFLEAQEAGVTGVPAMRRFGNDAIVVGAQPEALYRRWIERSLERREGLVETSAPIPSATPT